MDLYIERSGTGEKVVFVHGAGGNSASWVFQKEYLLGRVEVVLLDLPGRGRSGEQGRSSIADYADIVRDVIFDNDLQGCYLAGHSMGGLIGISLAITHPEILKGLILVSTGARLRVSSEILEWIMVDKERAVNLIMDMAFSKKSARSLLDGAVSEMMRASADTIFGDFLACDQADFMEGIKGIDLPTLIVCGLDDLLSPPKYSTYLHRSIPGSELLMIPDAGHIVPLEKPEDLSRAIEAFLSRR